MGWLLLLGVLIWLAGGWLDVSRGRRGAVLAALWALITGALALLPPGHVLAQAWGPLSAWLILGGVVLLVLGYMRGLALLKTRVREEPAPDGPQPLFSDAELARYARHIVLRELGGPGQKKLKEASVLVIGAGGLGAPALLYLAAAGVGRIGIVDDDEVSLSNLQRQVVHGDADVGDAKVFSATRRLKALNPHVEIRPYKRRFDDAIAAELLADYDLILDGSDNFDTRYLSNRTAVAAGKPLVSGALSQWEGQLSVFHPASGAPCYACIFPEAPAEGLAPSCAEAGVVAPLPGVVGAMMAGEAVKLITGAGAALRGEMMIYDALWGETRKIALKRRPGCPVCGATDEVTP
ncbi:Molybdopterin or thiamine biosynthesis adenylyltransferase [Pseudooceanicola antarcticus]|uniref:Molybdopterin-synthase adenylyltransferase n=1 Tax=Pseudooceanicola antarcticus TaxID=1247613 RepID=A0A285IS66_9RHOB|nr:molybdopterin-synthase adenylyltransferase MoeB [Pseudooceanicola antarcticus]PJE31882.1 molybdopterin-synthase adenylyltransferase MoeB [Pseudooceanicola antarcticus]SNY50673.1 Molybdopterin or thiamine biosynthesis adenylyltransferase [Pseudooceanicola antarcticus]